MLKGSTRKHLRGLAHGLRPLVQVGKEGLSETVLTAIGDALEAHELVKVRMTADRDERRAMAEVMEQRLQCECVGQIGRMAILFRQQSDPERRKIDLPSG